MFTAVSAVPAVQTTAAAEVGGGAGASGAEGGAGGGVVGVGGPTLPQGADLDRLVTQLYERIRSHLQGELLVDRERAGLLVDPC
jgi:hypothetical protein